MAKLTLGNLDGNTMYRRMLDGAAMSRKAQQQNRKQQGAVHTGPRSSPRSRDHAVFR